MQPAYVSASAAHMCGSQSKWMYDPNLGLVGMENNTVILCKSFECKLCLINWAFKLRSNLFHSRRITLVHNAAHDSVMKARVVEGLAVASIDA